MKVIKDSKNASVPLIGGTNSPLLILSDGEVEATTGDKLTCTVGEFSEKYTFDSKVIEGESTNRIQVFRVDESQIAIYEGNWTASDGRFYHMALTRVGNEIKFYIEGSQIFSREIGEKDKFGGITNNSLHIGAHPSADGTSLHDYFEGYVDEVRITRGLSRYPKVFLVPDKAFETDAYVRLLLHFEDFIDYSAAINADDVALDAGDKIAIVFNSSDKDSNGKLKLRFGGSISVMGGEGTVGPKGPAGPVGEEGPMGPTGGTDPNAIKYAIVFG